MEIKEKILVTGAGGFIGHHLVRYLKNKGYWVRGTDIEYPKFSPKDEADEFLLLDLKNLADCKKAVIGIDKVYTFSANMGGISFTTGASADITRGNVLINTNMAEASRLAGVKRLFFSSSACVYPSKQNIPEAVALKESDVYPAYPDGNSAYSWEKLYSEIMYQAYYQDYGLDIRIARFDTIYGIEETYEGGKEKVPAAICRQVAMAENEGEIEVWGDGEQTRCFLYVDDCVEGIYRLMESDYKQPLNIGGDRLISINDFVHIVAEVAGKKVKKIHLDKPQGSRGRKTDLTLAKKFLGWEPKISLEEGIEKTYKWIEKQICNKKVVEEANLVKHFEF